MSKVLSISVAAYNVKQFIEQCLDSFVDSGVIEDVEVIVTDDGSKDETPEIVSRYAEKYPHSIILVRQENAGPGSTVNSGIAHATGKYFRMVDGDDWVNPEDFKILVEKLKNTDSDAVINNYICVDDKTAEQRKETVTGITANKELAFSKIAPVLQISMHNFIIKTEIMKEYVKLFNCFYTDMQYLLFPIRYIKTVTFYDLYVYMYRVSLSTQSMNPKSLQRNIKMHRSVFFSLLEYYNEYEKSPEYNENTSKYIINKIIDMAGCHLYIYLSYKPSAAILNELYGFFGEFKKACPKIYGEFEKLKTVKLLNMSKLLYYPIAAIKSKDAK